MSERAVLDLIMVCSIIIYLILTRKLSRKENPYIGLMMPILAVLLACVFFFLADLPLVSLSRRDGWLYMTFCAGLACIGYFIYGFEKIKEIQAQQLAKQSDPSVCDHQK